MPDRPVFTDGNKLIPWSGWPVLQYSMQDAMRNVAIFRKTGICFENLRYGDRVQTERPPALHHA
jgi:hypothetical protein